MRLIDADKLPAICTVIVVNGHRELTGWISAERIDEAPTVKAIPIEWLNKRAEEIAFAYWTNARNKMTLPLNELPLLLDQIIGDWERENADVN